MLSTATIDRFLQWGPEAGRALGIPPPPDPAVLFLPGGPGSKLTRISDGKVIFGKNCVPAKELALTKPEDVEAEVLLTYNAFGIKKDIYKSVLEHLEGVVTGAGGILKPWGFDWRLDTTAGVKGLQAELAKPFYHRRAVFILAHSHGGVVAWKWQEQYESGQQLFTVDHMVLLGSPLRGACGFARVLTKGFGNAPAEPDDWMQDILLAGIRPAAFTMPGTFLIMSPQPPQKMYEEGRLDAACLDQIQLFPDKDPIASILDPHSVDFWKSRLGRQFVDKAWKKLGIKEDEFWKLLDAASTAGNASRPDLSTRNIRHMRYFYSTDYPTTRKLRLVLNECGELVSKGRVKKEGMGNDNPLQMVELGDSRVLGTTAREPRVCTQAQPDLCPECDNATSAKPSCCLGPLKGVCVDRITLSHGNLPKSEEFQRYVKNILGPTIKAMRVRAFFRAVSPDINLRNRLAGLIREMWRERRVLDDLAREVDATATDATAIRELTDSAFQ
jgi:hypothetical protein